MHAGGALAISTVSNTTERKPKAMGLYSPWVNLETFGDTFEILSHFKPMVSRACLEGFVSHYVEAKLKTNPLYSPSYSNLPHNFPDIFVATGTRDIFQSQGLKLVSNRTTDKCYNLEGGWLGYQDSATEESRACADALVNYFKLCEAI